VQTTFRSPRARLLAATAIAGLAAFFITPPGQSLLAQGDDLPRPGVLFTLEPDEKERLQREIAERDAASN